MPTLTRHCRCCKQQFRMKLLEYNIKENIRAFSTYRGEGPGNYGGFNITHYCGDTALHVTECRRELCLALGIDDERLILPRQTHGDEVVCIDRAFMELPGEERTAMLHGIDAIITDLPRTCIGVSTADCIPLLLYDSAKGVVAAVHAGWRGTVAHIARRCIERMKERYGCCKDDIRAVIGPGISMDSFEVGDEVYDSFANAGFPMERIARRYPSDDGGEKWHIDLWEANRLQLMESGIRAENITVAGICTYKEHESFFSARRLGINSGRIFNGIILL